MKISTGIKTTLTLILFALSFFNRLTAQEMTPPKPVESACFDKWVGTWVGENEHGGMPGKQTIVCAWDLNHQFLVVNVTGTGDKNPDFVYKGTGYYTIDNNGGYIGYWFDVFGLAGLSESKGKVTGSSLEGSVTAPGYTGVETAVFNGDNEVTMISKGTYEFNGQKMPIEMKSVYKRK